MTNLEKTLAGLESLHVRLLDAATRDKIAMLDAMIVEDALDLLKAQQHITGETSDGYHTFNELYHHRAVLFSVIVANYPDRAWKSKKHHDGTMYDGMFIVGIDTPDGQATYHYVINPYWDMFDCKVREFAPEWDGHTPAQAIERIGKLKAQELRYTPREVRNALMDYGQHDLNIKLGEVIKYDPVQIEDILMNGREVARPVTPHMVDWGIYECPKCKTRVDATYNYCKCCGRAVKWG